MSRVQRGWRTAFMAADLRRDRGSQRLWSEYERAMTRDRSRQTLHVFLRNRRLSHSHHVRRGTEFPCRMV